MPALVIRGGRFRVRQAARLRHGGAHFLHVPQVFEEDEPGDGVAIAGRRIGNLAFFLEPARGTVQGFVGQFIRRVAPFPAEVRHQAPAHVQIGRPTGRMSFIEPLEKVAEGRWRGDPVFFHLWWY